MPHKNMVIIAPNVLTGMVIFIVLYGASWSVGDVNGVEWESESETQSE